MADLLLISSSTVHPSGYLDHCADALQALYRGLEEIVFVPYARPSGLTHEAYTEKARERFGRMGLRVTGLHEADDPVQAIGGAQGVFIGGGNTFLLLRALYEADVVDPIRRRVHEGMPYAGTSAGANVAGRSIGTTNDMPIVYPPSFDALGLVPFNVNPHYLDPDPSSTHKGETRETRIREFLEQHDVPVVGLREGAMLRVTGASAALRGDRPARVFRRGRDAEEYDPGAAMDFLLS